MLEYSSVINSLNISGGKLISQSQLLYMVILIRVMGDINPLKNYLTLILAFMLN